MVYDRPHRFAAAARIDEVTPGRCVSRSIGALELLICNAGGSYYAVENRCSHQGKPLTGGRLIGHEIACPFHGAAFDIRDGHHTCFPASRPIRVFATRLTGSVIEVATDRGPPPAPILLSPDGTMP